MWASESGRVELKMVPSLPLLSWESSVSLNKTLFRSSHMVVLYRQVLCIKPFCKESVPNFYLTWRCVASKLAKHWTPLLAFFKILKLQVEDICSVEHPVEVALSFGTASTASELLLKLLEIINIINTCGKFSLQ